MNRLDCSGSSCFGVDLRGTVVLIPVASVWVKKHQVSIVHSLLFHVHHVLLVLPPHFVHFLAMLDRVKRASCVRLVKLLLHLIHIQHVLKVLLGINDCLPVRKGIGYGWSDQHGDTYYRECPNDDAIHGIFPLGKPQNSRITLGGHARKVGCRT